MFRYVLCEGEIRHTKNIAVAYYTEECERLGKIFIDFTFFVFYCWSSKRLVSVVAYIETICWM